MTRELEGHTVKRFDGELGHLHLMMLEMGSLVQNQARTALHALLEEDLVEARHVLDRELQVTELGLKIDNTLVDILARRGPLAKDLRAVISFSKGVKDLERVGINARRIAQIALNIYATGRSVPSATLLRDVGTMGELGLSKLEQGLKVLDSFDCAEAEGIVENGSSELVSEFQSSLRRLSTFVLEDARNVGHSISITLVLRALERIGEYGQNLAEYVIYMQRGENVRERTIEQELSPQGDDAAA